MRKRPWIDDAGKVPRGVWWVLVALALWLLTLIYVVVRFYGAR